MLGLVFILLSAFFSGSETAFQRLNHFRFAVDARDGHKHSKAVLWIYDRFDKALNGVLIGNTVVNVGLSVIFTNLFLKTTLPEGVASLLASVIMTIVVYFFAETLPKQIAAKIPNKVASAFVYPLVFFYFLFWPLMMVFKGLDVLISKIFKSKEEPSFTEEDLLSVIEQNEDAGALEKNESEIIQNSIDWGDMKVKEVLTPKYRLHAIDTKGLTTDKLLEDICDTTYSRIPLYYGKKDNIIGVLMVKGYLSAYINNKNVNYLNFVEKPYVISPKTCLSDLADGFRSHKTQMAIVKTKDELLGVVTMEDLLEELVGDIDEVIELPEEVA